MRHLEFYCSHERNDQILKVKFRRKDGHERHRELLG